MICRWCNEEYDSTMFPRCPYCLCENIGVDAMQQGECEGSLVEEEITYSAENKMFEEVKDNDVSVVESKCFQKDIDIVDMPLLSMRCKNILRRNGIFKLSELQEFLINNKLSALNYLGKESEAEIIAAVIFMKNQEDITGFFEDNQQHDNIEVDTRIKVADAFNENAFNLFVRYCDQNKIFFVDELDDLDFQQLSNIKGMGKGKINAIIKRYREVTNNPSDMINVIKPELLFENINSELCDMTVEVMALLGISTKMIGALKKAGYITLGQLESIGINRFSEAVGKRNIDKFRQIEGRLELPVSELCISVFDASKEDDDYLVALMRSSGHTLQEIADNKGVTRERIRQIAKKFFDKISPLMDQIISKLLRQKGYITVAELLDIFDDDDYDKIVIEACHVNDKLEYLDFADIFVPVHTDEKNTEECILDLATEFVGDGIDLYENLEKLDALMTDNGFPYMECGEFINLIQKYGYKLYGDYAIKGNQSYGFLCAKLVAKEFPNGIKLYESEDLDILRNLVKKQYGDLEIPDNNRAFSSRLTDYLILSGRGMVTAIENVNIDISVLEQIKEYIDETEETSVYYTELFARFEGLLRMTSNVDNYNFLHGVLMLYYPEEYIYTRDCLTKKGEGGCSGALGDRVKKIIKEKNGPVHKNDLKMLLPGVSDAMLLRAIYEDKELFQWEHNYYSSAQILSFTEDDKMFIHNSISKIMDENYGYCSDALLYHDVIDKLANCFETNGIMSPSNLFYICTYLFGDEYDFRRPHIGRKGMLDTVSTKEVAMHMLGNTDEISFNEYSNIAEHLMWPAVTSGFVFFDIEKDYIRISDDRYVKKDLFVVDDMIISKIEDVICRKMKYDVFPIINFEDWELLPDIEYEWNRFLLHSIVEKMSNKLRIIETRTTDRRYERGIIVYADSEFVEYSEIVVHCLNENGYTSISEAQMLSFLIVNGLTYKMIPKELYNADAIKYIDDKFIIL